MEASPRDRGGGVAAATGNSVRRRRGACRGRRRTRGGGRGLRLAPTTASAGPRSTPTGCVPVHAGLQHRVHSRGELLPPAHPDDRFEPSCHEGVREIFCHRRGPHHQRHRTIGRSGAPTRSSRQPETERRPFGVRRCGGCRDDKPRDHRKICCRRGRQRGRFCARQSRFGGARVVKCDDSGIAGAHGRTRCSDMRTLVCWRQDEKSIPAPPSAPPHSRGRSPYPTTGTARCAPTPRAAGAASPTTA